MKRLTYILVFIAFVLIVLKCLDYYVTKKYNSDYFDLCNKWRWVLHKKKNSYDLVVHGSSRAANIFDAGTFERNTGLKTINIATSGSSFADNYALLHLFLSNGNKTKSLLLQVDIYSMCADTSFPYPFHDFEYLPYLKDNTIADAMKDNVPLTKYWLWKSIPFAGYAEFNNTYNMAKILKGGFNCDETQSEYTTTNGYTNSEAEKPFAGRTVRQYLVDKKDVKYLNKIIELCNQQGIKLIAYNAPEYAQFIQEQKTRIPVINYISNLLAESKIPFINFSTNKLCENKALFGDPTHLNTSGVQCLMDTITKSSALRPLIVH